MQIRPLTAAQKSVLDLILEAHSTKEIATRLGNSVKTVEVHVTAILKSYGVHSRLELFRAVYGVPIVEVREGRDACRLEQMRSALERIEHKLDLLTVPD